MLIISWVSVLSSLYRQQAPRETPESGVTPLLASGALVLLCCFSGLWFPHLCHQDGQVTFYRLVQLQPPWSGSGTLGQDLGLGPGLLENRHPGSATTWAHTKGWSQMPLLECPVTQGAVRWHEIKWAQNGFCHVSFYCVLVLEGE